MFQDALGRIGSAIRSPDESLSLEVFVDAGGRAAHQRLWGGLVVVGDYESDWINRKMAELRATYSDRCSPTGELKGAALSTAEIQAFGRQLRSEDRRILFWANWYRSAADPDMIAIVGRTQHFLDQLRPDPYRLDALRIAGRYQRMAGFLKRLKGINRHKVISILAHLGWLFEEIRRSALGMQLGKVRVSIDREDIPRLELCAEFLQMFVAASLQDAGMSRRLTWRSLWADLDDQAIRIDPELDSARSAGIQMVDILLQPIQRRLPGFGGRPPVGVSA